MFQQLKQFLFGCKTGHFQKIICLRSTILFHKKDTHISKTSTEKFERKKYITTPQ